MDVLLSNYPPAKLSKNSFKDFFERQLNESDIIRIASGYISSEALTELKKIVELNSKPHIELLIGMHFFEGFTKTQYQAAINLSEFLNENKMGRVLLATTFKFHGKMYAFHKEKNPFAAVIGSSNLSSIFDSANRLYECDFLIDDSKLVTEIDTSMTKLYDNISEDISNVKIEKFNEYNSLLENHDGVEKIGATDFIELKKRASISFEIPIKANDAPKSNLNIFHGKGRETTRGLVLPRPWYEAELIVPSEITKANGYPYNQEFWVITDDGWKFKCKTSGDYSKNFRSFDDLKILGKWIKGRLEQSGSLKIGDFVTDNTLAKYGRNTISLIGTDKPDIWLLDFNII